MLAPRGGWRCAGAGEGCAAAGLAAEPPTRGDHRCKRTSPALHCRGGGLAPGRGLQRWEGRGCCNCITWVPSAALRGGECAKINIAKPTD